MNKHLLFLLVVIFVVKFKSHNASLCGCKSLRTCYQDMVDILQYGDEVACVEDSAIGASTIMIFLKALKQFCGDTININSDSLTYEGRNLYEVVLSTAKHGERDDGMKPVIIIEAGQQAGSESVGLALYLIEQLIACNENNEMLQKVRWVILPCTNPDGMEYARFNRVLWKKNVKPSDDDLSFGVDISRNFDSQWAACERVDTGFSHVYQGPSSGSENETKFIKNILQKYKTDAKAYLSIRQDGHAIMYPFAYTQNDPPNSAQIFRVAAEITSKVNQRAGSVQLFMNESIFHINGKASCGHSVDYAHDLGIAFSYEMRVFLGSDNRVMAKFHTLPRGYDASLRAGYFSGIRELYNVITNDKKYGKLF